MLSAKEARRTAEDYRRAKEEEQLNEIEAAINRAAAAGENSCYVFERIRPEVSNILSGLGYEVRDCSSQKDGASFEIIW